MTRSDSSCVRRGCRAWVFATCLGVASIAGAQEPSQSTVDEARKLGHEGLRALEARDYALAEERFDRALDLHHAPTLYLARGRARKGRGKLKAAVADFQAVLAFPPSAEENRAFQRAREDAREELQRVESEFSHLSLVAPAPVQRVLVNGVEWKTDALGVARPLDPGIYAIEAVPAQGPARVYHVALAAGQHQQLTLEVDAAPVETAVTPAAVSGQPDRRAIVLPKRDRPPAEEADYTLAYVFGATTLAFVTGALVTGFVALDARRDFDENNRPAVARDEKQRLQRRATTWAWVNTGIWVGALGSGAAAAYTLFIAPAPSSHAGLRLVAAGRF